MILLVDEDENFPKNALKFEKKTSNIQTITKKIILQSGWISSASLEILILFDVALQKNSALLILFFKKYPPLKTRPTVKE